jgi:hypothetical protein
MEGKMENEVNIPVQNIEPKKFGGWLILIGIGIVISPLRIIQLLTFTHVPIFTDGTWEVLTTVGSEAYSPLWGPILSIEITINILLFASSIYLIYLFFKKKKFFRNVYAYLAIFTAIFILADSWAVTLVIPEMKIFDAETIKEFGRSLIACIIWVPYMFISERAKETFIK